MPKQKVKQINGSGVDQFYKGNVFICLECRKWGASAKLTEEKQDEYLKEDKDVIRAVQDVLLPEDKALLESMQSLKNQANGLIYRNSVPSPLPNLHCIKKSRIPFLDEELKSYQKEYYSLADSFVERSDKFEERFKKAKPNLYRADKYPSKRELRNRFVFRWTFPRVAPDESLEAIDPELYKREMENFKGMVQEMKNSTLKMLKSTVIERMNALKSSIDDGKFNQATINSVNNLLEKVQTVYEGFIDSTSMQKAIEEINLYLEGTDADMLRADEEFADLVGKMASDVVKTVEKVKEPKDSGRALMF